MKTTAVERQKRHPETPESESHVQLLDSVLERSVTFLARHKEFIGTATVIVASMLLLEYIGEGSDFPPMVQNFIAAIAVFLVIPILYCKIMLGRPLSALGFQRGNIWAGIGGSVLALVVALSALFVLWNFTPLLSDYRLPVVVEEKFFFFVLYELLLSGVIVLMFEVFFRGFIMLLWLRKWGVWSVAAQAVLFALLASGGGSIDASRIPALIFAPLAGLIAYQSRSIWYSLGATWFYLFLTDAFVLILR